MENDDFKIIRVQNMQTGEYTNMRLNLSKSRRLKSRGQQIITEEQEKREEVPQGAPKLENCENENNRLNCPPKSEERKTLEEKRDFLRNHFLQKDQLCRDGTSSEECASSSDDDYIGPSVKRAKFATSYRIWKTLKDEQKESKAYHAKVIQYMEDQLKAQKEGNALILQLIDKLNTDEKK